MGDKQTDISSNVVTVSQPVSPRDPRDREVIRVVWARARDYYSDRPFGKLSHAWPENSQWPICGTRWVSIDATLKDGGRCQKCERAMAGLDHA